MVPHLCFVFEGNMENGSSLAGNAINKEVDGTVIAETMARVSGSDNVDVEACMTKQAEKAQVSTSRMLTGQPFTVTLLIANNSCADVSETVKPDRVCDVDDITVGLGFSDKGLVNSDVSQADDYKTISLVSTNCFNKIVHAAKDFIYIKFMKKVIVQQQSLDTPKEKPKVFKNDDFVGSSDIASHFVLYLANMSNDEVNNILNNQGVILQYDDSFDELKIEEKDAIHIHTTEKLQSP
ncbi:hypothetical protein L1987_54720 [Smallanthus sonchifolius]|uniref:Uncharacterized protein n=1 Tax=Smallanthus sonchifolius TaxID=185202 RepID=A0ACB9E7D9_9ASTR|nr:hypothetical protein L1987_54720 [Smallanthus sonchifolius]